MYLSSEFLFSHWSGSQLKLPEICLFVTHLLKKTVLSLWIMLVNKPFNLYCVCMFILLGHILTENENKMTVIIYWSSVWCFYIFPGSLGVHKIKGHFCLPFIFVIGVPLPFSVLMLMSSYIRPLLVYWGSYNFAEMLCIRPQRTQSFSLLFFQELLGTVFFNFWAILMKNDSWQMAFWISCSYFI